MDRPNFIKKIHKAFKTHPIVAILGPRQCGKTTLARLFVEQVEGSVSIFDLEDPAALSALVSSCKNS
jgi:predicted AAA+ superfamily ATPase